MTTEMVSRCDKCDIRALADKVSLPGQDACAEEPVSGREVIVDTSDADRYCEEILAVVIPQMGWKEVKTRSSEQPADITWFADEFDASVKSGQVNIFPGTSAVCEKLTLFGWLNLMKSVFPQDYSFFPETWLLPEQFEAFSEHMKKKSDAVYVAKPTDGYSGKGLYLLTKPEDYKPSPRGDVLQEYVKETLTLDGFKIDLRLHVYVHSFSPLSVYVCREGYVRLATIPYEPPDKDNMNEACMHVTNYSYNIHTGRFDKTQEDNKGSIRRTSTVFKELEKAGYDITTMWLKIDHLVVRTLQAIAGQVQVDTVAAGCNSEGGPTCRQMMGFDIMLTPTLEPVLIEANHYTGFGITEERPLPDGGVEIYVGRKLLHVSRVVLRDAFTIMMTGEDRIKAKRSQKKAGNSKNHSNGNNNHCFQEELAMIREVDADNGFTLTPPAASQSGGPNCPSVLEPLANLFNIFVRGKGCTHLELESFLLFVEKCGLPEKGVDPITATNIYKRLCLLCKQADLDQGEVLNFFAFASGCCQLADSFFEGGNRAAKLSKFADFCLDHVTLPTKRLSSAQNHL